MIDNYLRLLIIKIIHTLVWAFIASCVIFVLVAGVLDILNKYVYAAIAVVFLEGIILLIFQWSCPLTLVAQKYTNDHEVNFDIFLPQFVAKHNKTIFTSIFIAGLILIIIRNIY